MRFSEFNAIFNPFDDNCYYSAAETRVTGKKRYLPFSSLSHLIKLGTVDDLEIGFELTEAVTLVETQDEKLIEFIKTKKLLNTYIIKNKDKYQILFKRNVDDKNLNNYTTNILSKASIKVTNTRNKFSIILPFKTPTNASPLLKFITEEYENKTDFLQEIPFELQPIAKKEHSNHNYNYSATTNYDVALKSIIQTLKSVVKEYDQVVACVQSINMIYFDSAITDEEIEEIFESENLVIKKFFNEGQPDYKMISDYIIEKLFIQYDEYSNSLYYYDEEQKVYVNDEKFIEAYICRLLPTLKSTNRNEIIDFIRQTTYLSKVRFNVEEFNVLFKNGLYDLKNDKFMSMNPSLYETNMIGANFYSTMKPVKTVDDFFDTLTCKDKDVEELIYQAIGYSMFRTNQYQTAFMCYGGGKNGKSTLFDLVKKVLDPKNVTKVSFKDLENTFRPAKLENKLASIAPDISSSEMGESDSMKSIISGDDVTIEKKNKDSYDRPVYATMWFGCNKLPRTPDNSYGFYRRFIVIPMKADLTHIKAGEGKQFHDKLMEQECIDYVAYRAIKAFRHVYAVTNEFIEPAVVKAETDYYRDISDSVRQYVKSSVWFEEDIDSRWPKCDAQYSLYRDWVKDMGYKEKGFNNFEASWELLKEEELKKRRVSE